MWKCGYKYLRCEKLLKICQIVPTLQIREHLVNILFCSAVSCSFMNASIHFLWTPNYAMTEYRVILLTANFSICFVLNRCIKRFPYLKASLSEALSSHVLCMLQLYTAWKKGHSTPFIAQYLLNIRMANVFVTFRYFSLIIFRM
jgi:hypothetical protein